MPINGMNWIWVFIFVFIIGQVIFSLMRVTAEEVSWSEFRREMLMNGDVNKINVINKEKAEIYIKEDKLGRGRYDDIESSNSGPHFEVSIGSVENLKQA